MSVRRISRSEEREILRRFLSRLDATNCQSDWDAVRAELRQYTSAFGLTFDGVRQLASANLY